MADKWQVCGSSERLLGDNEEDEEGDDRTNKEEVRGPSNLGPARRVAERPFLIVVGKIG